MLSRFLILIVAVATLAPVASAQRVFRASSIDLEQNERIDTIEAKVSRIESSVASLVAALEKKPQPVTIASQPAAVTPVSVIAQPATIRQASSQSGYYSQAAVQSYSQPVIQYAQAAGGCANGQCARPSYSTGRSRSFGFFRR